LGQKTENEDYAAEELRILDSLSSQIAMASENIRLIEDNVVKKQLEEQLQMARRIQQGFLPQEIPPVKGLEIAAGSRFCLDVAGDYYDVITLDNGQTVLAVGDVSGKGAGAALLMANLQASLRTAVGMGSSLENVVARVNDLICRNTPPEQYITFFVGVYDPEESTLSYVNAGHNPPMLVHENGDTRLLSTGGLILGFLPAMKYEQETVKLRPGDLIIMYTDGVSEAMNAAEEEFGEERLCQSVCARREHPLTHTLSALEKEVIEFHGSDCFDDDFTLLLVRVI
jgi:sigma-B regulation protein RsbU (phosphoserine phosphatase)